jgi:hypothetical protein
MGIYLLVCGMQRHNCMYLIASLPVPPAMSALQAIASPFRFDSLLRGLEAVPYIFSAITATAEEEEEDQQAEHSQPASSGTFAGSSLQAVSPAKPAMPLAEVAADVRARVHAILGLEVGRLS